MCLWFVDFFFRWYGVLSIDTAILRTNHADESRCSSVIVCDIVIRMEISFDCQRPTNLPTDNPHCPGLLQNFMSVADYDMNVSLRKKKKYCSLFQTSLSWQNVFFFYQFRSDWLYKEIVRACDSLCEGSSLNPGSSLPRSTNLSPAGPGYPGQVGASSAKLVGVCVWGGTVVLALGLNSRCFGGYERAPSLFLTALWE